MKHGRTGPLRRGRRRSMGEDVRLVPAAEIELRPHRQEGEAGLREMAPPLALEERVEPRLEGVEVQHVARGVGELLLAQRGGAPIGGLLLLVELDAEELAAEILEAVAVGKGARQLGGDL